MTSKVLVLRCCNADRRSFRDFVWPESGPVSCLDWDPKPECGNGLHGWMWGVGDPDSGRYVWHPQAKWLVVEVEESEVVDLDGKVKFPRGNVVFCGGRTDAANYVWNDGGGPREVMFAEVRVGDGETVVVGRNGKAEAGDLGTARSGDEGVSLAGWGGTAVSGNNGKATAGDFGKAFSGHSGCARAGVEGCAKAGSFGSAITGPRGRSEAGLFGRVRSGPGGFLRLPTSGYLFDRFIEARVGEDGILPDVLYHVSRGVLVPC